MASLVRLKRRVYRLVHPRAAPSPRRLLLDRVTKGSACAEIGVWKGDFSERILEVVRPRRLHLIDPWQAVEDDVYSGARYGGKLVEGQAEMDAIHAAVQHRFAREREKGIVEVHRLASVDAATGIGDGELEFVYIDGNHLYEFVKADLEAFAPKVRAGGLIGGDDYGVVGWWEDGVTRAVDEFVASGAATFELQVDTQFLLRMPGR